MSNLHNLAVLSDSYKWVHHSMYPSVTEGVYSYFESRNGATFDETVFFGLQYYLREYLEGVVVTPEKVAFAEALAAKHFGNDQIFNKAGWQHILDAHGGTLPVKIRAVPEGTPVPTGNVLMTVENTDDKCYWLTNYLETILTHVWSASTVATLSRHTKKIMAYYLEETSESAEGLPFMLHDFGFRGVSSVESAAFQGAGHLVSFMGTDTIPAIVMAMEHYQSDVCAYSVPASEHSIMTSWGAAGEHHIMSHLLQMFPTGILSVVSDSYDIYNAVKHVIGEQLHDNILYRDGVFVVRPDSGDPLPQIIDLLVILSDKFGYTTNSKGYKVLNPKVKLLWGDGLDRHMIETILKAMKDAGWSAENIVFGMGGGLLQKVNRDTQCFAFKCSAQKREGTWHDVWKDPTDKSKVSKRGRLALTCTDGVYKTVPIGDTDKDILRTVFENGKLQNEITFEEIRHNARLI